MTRAEKVSFILSAVKNRLNATKELLALARSELNFINNPMFGFKPEDYHYPKISKRQSEDKVEKAIELLDKWNQALEYAKQELEL